MLALAMKDLSERELESVVAEYCSAFGCATVLNVQAPRGHNDHGAAAVRMSTEAEAEELAKSVSGARCGRRVIIKLAPHGRHISPTTTKNFFHPRNPPEESWADSEQQLPHEDRSYWGLALAGD